MTLHSKYFLRTGAFFFTAFSACPVPGEVTGLGLCPGMVVE